MNKYKKKKKKQKLFIYIHHTTREDPGTDCLGLVGMAWHSVIPIETSRVTSGFNNKANMELCCLN